MINIPIVLNNRNRLSTTRALVDDLALLGYTNIYILDMASTYEPLIEYYIDCPVQVLYLENLGHQALWLSGVIDRLKEHEYVVYSDSDIELHENVLPGFIEKMIQVAKDYSMDKVGLAIRIDDLPDNKFTRQIMAIEHRYWTKKLFYVGPDVYNAIVDTTFCVIRTGTPYSWNALRVAGNGFTCRHIPWYNIWDNLSDEEQFIIDHSDPKFSSYKQLLSQ